MQMQECDVSMKKKGVNEYPLPLLTQNIDGNHQKQILPSCIKRKIVFDNVFLTRIDQNKTHEENCDRTTGILRQGNCITMSIAAACFENLSPLSPHNNNKHYTVPF